jgi:hypothetical protein|eukprot:1634548-Prymnesium_polylepis.1
MPTLAQPLPCAAPIFIEVPMSTIAGAALFCAWKYECQPDLRSLNLMDFVCTMLCCEEVHDVSRVAPSCDG